MAESVSSSKKKTAEEIEAEKVAAGLVPAVDNTRSGEPDFTEYLDGGSYPDTSDPERVKVALATIDEYRSSLNSGNPLPIEYLAAKLGRKFD